MSTAGRLSIALVCVCVAACGASASARPYQPISDSDVVEQLPERSSPALAALKRHRALVALAPTDERRASAFARQAIDAARATGDPRYLGQAQAALRPWWDLPAPGTDVLLLRATIRQSQHDFAASLNDLDTLLAREPENPQARLTRATVLTVTGRYAEASADCARLAGRAATLVVAACQAAAEAATGEVAESYRRLAVALAGSPAQPALRAWAETLAGELALIDAQPRRAEAHFRAALVADPTDGYAKIAWADFLLDARRYVEVVALLADDTRNDAMLLRLTQAEKALPSEQAAFRLHAAWLADRFAAARRRGDELHLREEARHALAIEGDARRAVQLARRNFERQREGADIRLLLDAADAAGDASARALADDWIRRHRSPDRRAANEGSAR